MGLVRHEALAIPAGIEPSPTNSSFGRKMIGHRGIGDGCGEALRVGGCEP